MNAAVRLRQREMEGELVPAVATLMQALHYHTPLPPHILTQFLFIFHVADGGGGDDSRGNFFCRAAKVRHAAPPPLNRKPQSPINSHLLLVYLPHSDITHALLRPLTAKKEKKTKGETPYVIEQRKKAELAAKRAAAIEAARDAAKDGQGDLKEQGRDVFRASNMSGRRKAKREEVSERLVFDIGSNSGGGSSSSSSIFKTTNDTNAIIASATVKYKQVSLIQLPPSH